jgi:hypothetical protein
MTSEFLELILIRIISLAGRGVNVKLFWPVQPMGPRLTDFLSEVPIVNRNLLLYPLGISFIEAGAAHRLNTLKILSGRNNENKDKRE